MSVFDQATGLLLGSFEGKGVEEEHGFIEGTAVRFRIGTWVTPDCQWRYDLGEDHSLIPTRLPNGLASGRPTLVGNHWPATSVASQNGRYLLSRSDDATRLWDAERGRCLYTFPFLQGAQPFFQWLSPDGRYALFGLGFDAGDSGAFELWRINSELEPYVAPMKVCRPTESHQIAQSVKEFDAVVAQARAAIKQGTLGVAAELVTAIRAMRNCHHSPEAMELWRHLCMRLRRLALKSVWPTLRLVGHEEPVTCVCASPDGSRVLSGDRGGTLKVWDMNSGECQQTVRAYQGKMHQVMVTAMPSGANACFTSGGDRDDDTIRLWNIGTRGRPFSPQGVRTHLKEFKGHSFCTTSDARYLVSVGYDDKMRFWDISSGRCLRELGVQSSASQHLAFSLDEQHLFHGYSETALWKFSNGHLCGSYLSDWPSATVLPIDTVHALVFSDAKVGTWKVGTDTCTPFEDIHGSALGCLLPGNGYVALANWEPTGADRISFVDLQTGKVEFAAGGGHSAPITTICVTADGLWAISGSQDGSLAALALDWELAPEWPVSWDEKARPYLNRFKTLQTPYSAVLSQRFVPTGEEVESALTRSGRPTWTEADIQNLLWQLAAAGYGWVDTEVIQRELDRT